MTDVAYSTDEENFTFDSAEEALESLDDPQPGDVIYEGDVVKRPASKYWRGLEWLLEDMNEQAYEEAGEWAEDWPGKGMTKEGGEALAAGIKALINQHISVNFYTVTNVRQIEVTAEMLAAIRSLPLPESDMTQARGE